MKGFIRVSLLDKDVALNSKLKNKIEQYFCLV